MSKVMLAARAAIVLLTLAPVAHAAQRSNADDAVALVNRAIDYMKKNGNDKAIAEFNNLSSPFNVTSDINKNGDLYMFMFYANKGGVQVVHGKNAKIPGKDVIDMRDADGTYIIKEIIKACNTKDGKGWVNYKWPNPVSGAIESKQSYVVKVDEYCVGTGIYKP